MKLKSCPNTRTGARRWHDIFWKEVSTRTNQQRQSEQQPEKALPRLLVLLLACFPSSVVWLFSSCLVYSVSLCSAGSGAAAAEGCSMRTVRSVPLLDTWDADFKPLQVQTHTQTTAPPPRVARTNTKTKAYLYHLLSRSFSLRWSFKARGVSVVRPLLFSFRRMSSSLNLSSFSVSVFSPTSLPVCPRFPFSFCTNIFYGNFFFFTITFIFFWSVNSPQILTLKNKIHLNLIDFYLH